MRGHNVFAIDSTLSAQPDLRPAFTLIELLVVMGLIGFLASMLTYALLGAQADARVARTRGTITKLNDVILAQWEEYRYRPVDMRLESFVSSDPTMPTAPSRLQAHFRMLILRDTMRMEMPDRVTDLLFTPSVYSNVNGSARLNKSAYPHRFGLIYRALVSALMNSQHAVNLPLSFTQLESGYETADSTDPNYRPFPNTVVSVSQAQIGTLNGAVNSSELLYLIVANSQYAGSPALESFRASEIGDSDEDGLLEFIDAWGNPIQWIRWPTGYPSDLNRYSGTDAMDPLQTDWRYANPSVPEEARPRTIVPLIFSPGPDELNGVTTGFSLAGSDPPALVPIVYALMRQGSGVNRFYVDPFFTWDYQTSSPNGPNSEAPYPENHADGYRANQLGSIPKFLDSSRTEENTFATDNITNHDIILGL